MPDEDLNHDLNEAKIRKKSAKFALCCLKFSVAEGQFCSLVQFKEFFSMLPVLKCVHNVKTTISGLN